MFTEIAALPGAIAELSDATLKAELTALGSALGQTIYLIDALDDLRDDRERGRFNPCLSGGAAPEVVPARVGLACALLDAALEAVAREPAVIGLFLWKWFPGERAPRDFSMQGSAQRSVIAHRWRSPEP